MKNNDFDLKSLEKADDSVIEKLIQDNMLDDAEKDRIFRKSLELYSGTGNETTISGVEIYKKSKWRRLFSMAAVFLLAVGLCGGTAVLLNRGKPVIDDNSEEVTTDISTENNAAVVTSETQIYQTATKSTTEKITETSVKSTAANSVTAETTSENDEHDIPDAEETDVPNDDIQLVENPETTKLAIVIKTTAPIRTTVATQTVKEETTAIQTTAAPQTSEIGYTNSYLYMKLNSLDYHPYTCDGIPEYVITFPDGTTFYLNLSSKWVWKNDGTENEAALTDEIINWLNTYGYPGMTETTYMLID